MHTPYKTGANLYDRDRNARKIFLISIPTLHRPQIRNALKYVSDKGGKPFAADLNYYVFFTKYLPIQNLIIYSFGLSK